MILQELVLHNFGVYRGRQSIALEPPSANKPIVLFGGINGGGKTTILDALQLVLYGKFARCSNRGAVSYETFLQKSVNRAAPKHEGAALELQFRHASEGSEHTYRIHRSWSANGAGARERFEVLADGKIDAVLADSWSEHVERFIPSRISNLFFFDGEKIEAMADLETSSQMLAVGIQALLGLDLVDRLATDLVVLERRKVSEATEIEGTKEVDNAKSELTEVEHVRVSLHSERATLQTELDRREKLLRGLQDRFRAEGGELFEQRDRLETEKKQCDLKLREIYDELGELAAGSAPLLLLPGLLRSLESQARNEVDAFRSELVAQLLVQRDERLLTALAQRATPPTLIQTISSILELDRKSHSVTDPGERYLGLDHDSQASITALLGDVSKQLRSRIAALIDQSGAMENFLVELTRTLAQVPDHRSLSSLLEERERARLAVDSTKARLETIDLDLERARHNVDQKKMHLEKTMEKEALAALGTEDAERIVSYSRRVRGTLEKFRLAMVKRNIQRIEQLVLDSLKRLLRKESLVSDLRIDPNTFQITLLAPDGAIVPAERLSAGERQLMAVALLWGLAKASGRLLPAVIDTPLGRLDTAHRTNMVDRYFPHASHQVLLLSTDEEIDEAHYKKLRPFIGRSYLLDFDDVKSETRVRPGYFW